MDENKKRWSPEYMDEKKGTSIDPGSLDDNNKRWLPEKMDDKKVWAMGVWIITIRDGPLRIWMRKKV